MAVAVGRNWFKV